MNGEMAYRLLLLIQGAPAGAHDPHRGYHGRWGNPPGTATASLGHPALTTRQCPDQKTKTGNPHHACASPATEPNRTPRPTARPGPPHRSAARCRPSTRTPDPPHA